MPPRHRFMTPYDYYTTNYSSCQRLADGARSIDLTHTNRSVRPEARSEMSILLLTLRRDKSFLLTSAYSFPCSSDYRITVSCVLSLSRSRSLMSSALLASQLPSQSERILIAQFRLRDKKSILVSNLPITDISNF